MQLAPQRERRVGHMQCKHNLMRCPEFKRDSRVRPSALRYHRRASMEDILINITPQETRVAVLLAGVVQELHVERSAARGIVGNIYLGKGRARFAGNAVGVRRHRA